MQKKGKLFIISAPSGSGKTTLEKMLLEADSGLTKSISVTTRKPRDAEREGKDYYFISEDEFLKRKEKGEFLEWAKVFNYYYATPKKNIKKALGQGKSIILSIDVQGAGQIKKIYPEAFFIFIKAPSFNDLEDRLRKRLTDSQEDIKKRLKLAKHELAQIRMYDEVIINDDLNKAFKELKMVIKNQIERH